MVVCDDSCGWLNGREDDHSFARSCVVLWVVPMGLGISLSRCWVSDGQGLETGWRGVSWLGWVGWREVV